MATIAKRVAKNKDITIAPSTTKEKQVIKYSDKSEGQPNMVAMFDEMRIMLLQFVKGALVVRGDGNGQLHICSKKEIEVLGKKREEIHFADLLVQKGFVGFYFFPVYTDEVLKKELTPRTA